MATFTGRDLLFDIFDEFMFHLVQIPFCFDYQIPDVYGLRPVSVRQDAVSAQLDVPEPLGYQDKAVCLVMRRYR